MKELNPIPFNNKENKIDWKLIEFKERGLDFAILFEKKNKTIPETTNYRFGYIDLISGQKYWLFNGEATANNRAIAIEAYNQLLNFIKSNNLAFQPFCYKEYEKREL